MDACRLLLRVYVCVGYSLWSAMSLVERTGATGFERKPMYKNSTESLDFFVLSALLLHMVGVFSFE